MKIWPYVLAILAIFSSGWLGHSAYYAKEQLHAHQKAQQRFETQRAGQEKERQDLEKQIASDRAKSEQSLRKLLKENSQLRAEADANVDTAFLIYSRLCNDPAQCSLLYQPRTSETPSPTERPVTAEDVYRLLADLDQAIIQHNLGLEQLKAQLLACHN